MKIHSGPTPSIKAMMGVRSSFQYLTIGAPFFAIHACLHFCMCGHMQHPEDLPQNWGHTIDAIWITLWSISVSFAFKGPNGRAWLYTFQLVIAVISSWVFPFIGLIPMAFAICYLHRTRRLTDLP